MNEVVMSAEKPVEPVVGHRFVLNFAPPMPPGFYGAVVYRFEGGKLVRAEVEESLKP